MTTTAIEPSTRRYSIWHLLLVVPWVAIVIDAWAPIRDNSFLWHIRAGSLQLDLGSVLTADPFSFTMGGEPWRTQSWLAELAYAWAESSWGLGFVPAMMATVTTLTFVVIGLIAHKRSRSVAATAIVLLLSTLLLISFLVPRPVIFSYLLFALAALAWDDDRSHWSLPFIFWVWAAVHGSFALGLAFVGLNIVATGRWRRIPVLAVSGLATLLTAHGWGVVQMLLDFATARDTLSLLSEWQRPGLDSPVFLAFLAGLALIGYGLAKGSIPRRNLVVVVPFALVGFSALRAIPGAWFGLVPFVSMALAPLGRSGAPERFSTRAAAVFAAVVLALPFALRDDASLDPERFPLEVAGDLDQARTFHDDRVGGYLIWRDGPGRKVYIDDRAELYGARMAEFVAVRDGETDWFPVFERDRIEQALLPVDAGLAAELRSSGWLVSAASAGYVVLTRP